MKYFEVIYKSDQPYLRQKNPLAGTSDVSAFAYAQHEKQYLDAALRLKNPIPGVYEYGEHDLQTIWLYKGDEIIGDPAFIDSAPADYELVFKVIPIVVDHQEIVRKWLVECFGEEVARNKAERAFRFMEEALELVQAIGLSRDDVFRCVAYTFGRPPGEMAEEVGGVAFTLAALCHASGLNAKECFENEIARNFERKEAIIEKWKSKIVINPLN